MKITFELAAHTHTQASCWAVVSPDLLSKTSRALQPASGCHIRLGDCCLELFWCCSHVICITHPPVISCSQHISCACVCVCAHMSSFVCCKGLSPWCPISPNNHPVVMREMRFPLNNSRPARLDDLPTSQAAAEQTLTRARTHTHTRLPSARISGNTCTFKYTASAAQPPSEERWWWHSLFMLLLI